MKKLSILFVLLMSFMLGACNQSDEAAEPATTESSAPAMENEGAEATEMDGEASMGEEESTETETAEETAEQPQAE